jgi:hypothetical protein
LAIVITIGLTLLRLDNKLLRLVLQDVSNRDNKVSLSASGGIDKTDGLTGRRQAMGYEFAHVTHTHSSSADVWPIAFDTLQTFGYDTAPSDMEFYVCIDNNTEAISNLTSQWPWLRPVIYTDTLYPSKVAQCLEKIDAPYVFHMMEE